MQQLLVLSILAAGLTICQSGASDIDFWPEEKLVVRPSPNQHGGTAAVRDKRRRIKIRHRKSDDDKGRRDEGVYMVFDSTAERHGHKHPPSCIVLKAKAKLVIPLQIEDKTIDNKTIVVPNDAKSIGICGETEQRITLIWNNTKASGKLVKSAQITFLFEKMLEDEAIYLTDVWASFALFVEDSYRTITSVESNSTLSEPEWLPGTGTDVMTTNDTYFGTQTVLMSLKDARLWQTPFRFAYVCYTRLELVMEASTLPIQSPEELIIDPINNSEAYLVFDLLKVETFRKDRFTSHLTHLKYDCKDRWAYDYMPVLVSAVLFISMALVVLAYIYRTELGFTGHLAYRQMS